MTWVTRGKSIYEIIKTTEGTTINVYMNGVYIYTVDIKREDYRSTD